MGNSPIKRLDLEDFRDALVDAREFAKKPEFLWRDNTGGLDELRVVRRWNSHTPSLLDVWGGGYFMRWQGKGTVIDPGASFLRLLNLYTPYGLQDLDMIVATHDHLDHCGDLGTLISLLRAYNGPRKDAASQKHMWDLVVSHGVAAQLGTLLVHPDNAEIIRCQMAQLPEEITGVAATGGSAAGNPESISTKYGYRLATVSAFHDELLRDSTGFGVRLTLDSEPKSIVISSDTAIARELAVTHGSELVDGYRGANLLILHVGSIEKRGESRLPQHLGFTGVVEVLSKLAVDNSLQLVVLSEWGYEFGRLGLWGRSRFTELVVEALNNSSGGRDKYFAAVDGAPPVAGKVPVLPADLNLRISLPDLGVWPDDKPDAVPAVNIRAIEGAAGIRYVKAGP